MFDLTLDGFLSSFRYKITTAVEQYGVRYDSGETSPSTMVQKAIDEIYRRYGHLVIIIDEYDSPITSLLNNEEIIPDVRLIMNSFYATIKNRSDKIRFFFMTGIVKLANLSVFSALNNLADISMLPEFTPAFGYTESELGEYFGEGIDEYLSSHTEISRDAFLSRIRSFYDGYRFSPYSDESVYNLVSIGFFFTSGCRFSYYWDQTAVPSFAVKLAMRVDLSSLLGGSAGISESSFYSFDISRIADGTLRRSDVLALLYYAGYLTIKGMDDPVIELGYPNDEIGYSFTSNLIEQFSGKERYEIEIWAKRFRESCDRGDEEAVRKMMEEYFAAFPYDMPGRDRKAFYHGIFHSIFVMTGIYSISEDREAGGRSDEAVITDHGIWIFELKVDRSAEEALKQIKEKGYGRKYLHMMKPGMAMRHVGVSFSSETREIADWKCVTGL